MGTWIVTCGACNHTWTLAGNWSDYEREQIESRPCPCCSAYTLMSPEPRKPMATARPRPTRPSRTREMACARRAG